MGLPRRSITDSAAGLPDLFDELDAGYAAGALEPIVQCRHLETVPGGQGQAGCVVRRQLKASSNLGHLAKGGA